MEPSEINANWPSASGPVRVRPASREDVPGVLALKKFYVQEDWRSHGVGHELMRALAAIALKRGCAGLKWTVADWNDAGMRFYQALGASCDRTWLNYGMDVAALRALTSGTTPE